MAAGCVPAAPSVSAFTRARARQSRARVCSMPADDAGGRAGVTWPRHVTTRSSRWPPARCKIDWYVVSIYVSRLVNIFYHERLSCIFVLCRKWVSVRECVHACVCVGGWVDEWTNESKDWARACVRACVRACARARVRACVRARMCSVRCRILLAFPWASYSRANSRCLRSQVAMWPSLSRAAIHKAWNARFVTCPSNPARRSYSHIDLNVSSTFSVARGVWLCRALCSVWWPCEPCLMGYAGCVRQAMHATSDELCKPCHMDHAGRIRWAMHATSGGLYRLCQTGHAMLHQMSYASRVIWTMQAVSDGPCILHQVVYAGCVRQAMQCYIRLAMQASSSPNVHVLNYTIRLLWCFRIMCALNNILDVKNIESTVDGFDL